MFYCSSCAKKNDWPDDTLEKSEGRCGLCGRTDTCNYVPSSRLPTVPRREPRTLSQCQHEVDAWICEQASGYWTPHEIFTRLGSEVGELGKEINHEFGPIKKKSDEKPSSVTEECGDIVFTVICLLNSMGLSLQEAFEMAMAKCYERDKDRFEKKKV